jgi:hypothetical protein
MSLTCGYTNGDINKPMTCGTNGLHCSNYAKTDGYNFGCCGSPDTGCYMSACYDYRAGGPATDGNVILGGDSGGAGFYWSASFRSCTTIHLLTRVQPIGYSLLPKLGLDRHADQRCHPDFHIVRLRQSEEPNSHPLSTRPGTVSNNLNLEANSSRNHD